MTAIIARRRRRPLTKRPIVQATHQMGQDGHKTWTVVGPLQCYTIVILTVECSIKLLQILPFCISRIADGLYDIVHIIKAVGGLEGEVG